MLNTALMQALLEDEELQDAVLAQLNNPDFWAPLETTVVLRRGYGAASFTRTTARTITNHEGKYETLLAGEVGFTGARRVRNLAGNSENLSTTSGGWSWNGTSGAADVTSGATDPDSGTGAYRLTSTAGDNSWYRTFASVSGNTYVNSVWVRRVSGSGVVRIINPSNAAYVAITAQLTTSWQRFSVTTAATGATSFLGVNIVTVGDIVDVWHPQTEDVTGRANQNPSEYVSVGAAKLNELTFTEDFDNAAWTKTNVTVTANNVAGPDGVVSADKLEYDAVVNARVQQSVAGAAANGRAWTGSVYLRADAPTTVNIQLVTLPAGQWASEVTVNITTSWQRFSISDTTSGITTDTAQAIYFVTRDGVARTIYARDAQLARGLDLTTYFPVGNVYPYHGVCVDGVKCFDTYNGNTVSSNVVTEATGRAITTTKNQSAWLPGVSGSYFSTPDSAVASITGDLGLRAHAVLADWTPTGNQFLIAKRNASAAYNLYINTLGQPAINWWDSGGVLKSATATVAVSAADGTLLWVRADLDVDNGAGGHTVTFYTSQDGATWTQLGTAVTAAGTTSIRDTADGVEIGSWAGGTTDNLKGTIYRAQVYNGTTLAVDFNPQDHSTGATFTSSTTGEVWTLNGGAAIRNFPMRRYREWEARTNLVKDSEDFSTANWTNSGTPTLVAAAKKCGQVVLALLGDDSAAAIEGKLQTVTFTGNGAKAFSLHVAQDTSTTTQFSIRDNTAAADRLLGFLTWTNGTPVLTMSIGTHVETIALADGVFRLVFLTTAITAANTNSLQIYPASNLAGAVALTGNVYVGGVMAQNATMCGDYVPTAGAAVTYNVDALTYPTAGNALAAAGAAFAQIVFERTSATNPRVLALNAGADAPLIVEGVTGQPRVFDGTTFATSGLANLVAGATSKIAASWGGATMKAFASGVAGNAQVFDGAMTLSANMEIAGYASGAESLNGNVGDVRLWRAANDGFLTRATA